MTGLQQVRLFHVPNAAVERTMHFLASIGRTGHEALVVWVGNTHGLDAFVTEAVVPPQTPIRSPDGGLAIYIGPDALHELNVWLHEQHLRLLVQVHSHGEEAYHSDTDDRHSIVTTLGGLSVVVPSFGMLPFGFDTCRVHRLWGSGWLELNETESIALVKLEE